MNKLSKLKEVKYYEKHKNKLEGPLRTYSDGKYKITVYSRYVIKEDTENIGKHWIWLNSKASEKKEPKIPWHQLTIAKLASLGHKVRITHLRYATYDRSGDVFDRGTSTGKKFMVVPASFRKHPDYELSPYGGYTHISVKTKDGSYVCVTSECSVHDNFCHKQGVFTALERLDAEEVKKLSGL